MSRSADTSGARCPLQATGAQHGLLEHVERGSVVVHCQTLRASAFEVAAMVEGAIRRGTTMNGHRPQLRPGHQDATAIRTRTTSTEAAHRDDVIDPCAWAPVG